MDKRQQLKQKLKERVTIKRLDTVYCKLKPSPVHGVGIFAIKNIPKGTNPFKNSYLGQDGIVINKNKPEYSNLNDAHKKMLDDYHPAFENNVQYISGFPNQLIWTNYLNYIYDERANMELLQNGEWSAKRIIKAGEELLENPKELFNLDGSHKIYKVKEKQYRTLI